MNYEIINAVNGKVYPVSDTIKSPIAPRILQCSRLAARG